MTVRRVIAAPASVGGGAAFVAVCALLISIGAGAMAVYAVETARNAQSAAALTGDRSTASPTSTAQQAASPTPRPSPSASAVPTFIAEFVGTQVITPPAAGCTSVFVDVDTLQVGILAGHEFYLTSCLGPTSVRIDHSSGAVSTSGVTTPQACMSQIATNGIQTELVLQMRTGLSFCLLTSKEEATTQAIPQRVALIEVRSIASDGSVILVVSTFRLA